MSSESVRPGATERSATLEVTSEGARWAEDALATEEPLEIRLAPAAASEGALRVAVTMRTPGADFELAAGFLYSEGLVSLKEEVRSISYCLAPPAAASAQGGGVARGKGAPERWNVVNVALRRPPAGASLARLERHFAISSACGVCGKATLEALHQAGYEKPLGGPYLPADLLWSLPAKLRSAQRVFDATGGLHAAGAFDSEGELVAVREDVGRHNAMDKLAGWALLAGRVPLSGHGIVVSGRASFELVQKALRLGAGMLCSVSAPSSLAVGLAREFGLTLVSFLREGRFKVYSCPERVVLRTGAPAGSLTR